MRTLLPPEIADRVIDYLHDDRAALSRCALVCRNWTKCARFHLSLEVVIEGIAAKDRPILEILESPHCTLTKAVAHLALSFRPIWGQSTKYNQCISTLPRAILPGIQTLFIGWLKWEGLVADTRDILHNIPLVCELELQSCVFQSCAEVMALIYSFPALQVLTINQVLSPSSPGMRHPPPAHLRELFLSDCAKAELLDALVPGDSLESLTLGVVGLSEVTSILASIHRLVQLKHLDLAFSLFDEYVPAVDFCRQVKFDNHTSLTSIEFSTDRHLLGTWFGALCSTTRLRSITVRLRVLFASELESVSWAEIDEICALSQFEDLEEVYFNLGRIRWGAYRAIAQEGLWQLDARDILYLCPIE